MSKFEEKKILISRFNHLTCQNMRIEKITPTRVQEHTERVIAQGPSGLTSEFQVSAIETRKIRT